MSEWAERITGSAILESLDELGAAIASAETGDVAAPELARLARLRTVLTHIGKRIDGLDPELIVDGVLPALASHVQRARDEVRAFIGNANPQQLVQAQGPIDDALRITTQLASPADLEGLTGLREAASLYRDTMTRHLEAVGQRTAVLEAQLVAAQEQLPRLEASISKQIKRSTSIVDDQQAQFSISQDAHAARVDSALGTQQEQFSSAQEARNQSHAEAQNARQARFDELLAEYAKSLGERAASFDANAKELHERHTKAVESLNEEQRGAASNVLQEIQEHKQKVEKLVGVIGNLGVTSGHQLSAKRAQRAVWFWQAIAVLAMVYLVYIATAKFLPSEMQPLAVTQNGSAATTQVEKTPVAEMTDKRHGPFDWPSFALRVYVSLTIGVLAAYAGTQADRYQRVERRHRQMALELEAIGPFVQPLPEAQQQKFRLAIGERSFGRDDDAGTDKSPTSAVDLLKALDTPEGRGFLKELLAKGTRPVSGG